ncbi:cell wall hydrolase/autolysin [Thermincola ferriacetica]|uniref:Cell wall hydrolase/autolysin n=1 Tax=Thermincola ferriacetica TaxID=281456 RepID=A0A0L6W1A2_9FIRM|nr:N-acetylmuramoyl-L-alanine amidase [Thermincola ferriacetica]KNZ69251.1 cell wall hydrolase/autolysin [Thermincola ferriacetica]
MAKKLVIDPGHGGDDPGALGYGLQEKNIAFDIALKLRNKLANYADVRLTRTTDTFVSLAERALYANRVGADLFLSVHVNAGGGTGFESFIYTAAWEETQRLRDIIHKEIADFYRRAGFPDRGKKKANFAVLRETAVPAILLENLFIDRREDALKLKEDGFREEVAGAIAQAVTKALRLEGPAKPPVPPPQPPSQPPTHWAIRDFQRLKDAGLVFGEHNLDANVTWGEMAATLARLLDKLDSGANI